MIGKLVPSLAILACGLIHGQSLGVFEGRTDVGTVLHPGSADYDAARRTYTISGSGENVWAAADAFQFVWKKVSGDVSLTADVIFPATGGDPHKKAMLMVRQSLDADSAYADIALHGVGLTSLQARDAKGAATHEVQSNLTAPRRLRLVKRGSTFYMYLAAREGEEPQMAGGSFRVPMEGVFYVGIGVSAHNKDAVEQAIFANVELNTEHKREKNETYSTLETITVSSTDARVALVSTDRLESPTWSPDGKWLLFNSGGHIERVDVESGQRQSFDTGFAQHCTAFHGISPDGKQLAFSDESRDRGRSAVYIVPLDGGIPEGVTALVPSTFQSWAPDGKNLLIYAERRKSKGLYTIPVTGGSETFVAPGVIGTFSPDGKTVYYASAHAGGMQIWRSGVDGKGAEQLTSDEFGNWYPHISPDGKQLVFLSLDKTAKVIGPARDVSIRVMTLQTKAIKVLAKFVGGEGTMEAPCWSPDGRRLAFVSYQSAGKL